MKRTLVVTLAAALAWTGCSDLGTEPEEVVSTPVKPTGPDWLLWDDPTGTYTTGGATSSLGHPIVYEFHWGDGFSSGWGPAERWTGWEWRGGVRRYTIRAQARCALHIDAVSPQSQPLVVTIEEFESFPPDTWITSCPDSVIDFNTFAVAWTGSDNVTASNKLQSSFFLEGYDGGWGPFLWEQEWGYRRLPDGAYTFHVRTRDEAGNVDPTPATCSFRVAAAPSRAITVTRPAEGEVLPDSTSYTIAWRYAGDVYAVNAELYARGARVGSLARSLMNVGAYEWMVSSDNAGSTTALQVKVSDANDAGCFAWSGEFSIGPRPQAGPLTRRGAAVYH